MLRDSLPELSFFLTKIQNEYLLESNGIENRYGMGSLAAKDQTSSSSFCNIEQWKDSDNIKCFPQTMPLYEKAQKEWENKKKESLDSIMLKAFEGDGDSLSQIYRFISPLVLLCFWNWTKFYPLIENGRNSVSFKNLIELTKLAMVRLLINIQRYNATSKQDWCKYFISIVKYTFQDTVKRNLFRSITLDTDDQEFIHGYEAVLSAQKEANSNNACHLATLEDVVKYILDNDKIGLLSA